jgi:hypothetical protein
LKRESRTKSDFIELKMFEIDEKKDESDAKMEI